MVPYPQRPPSGGLDLVLVAFYLHGFFAIEHTVAKGQLLLLACGEVAPCGWDGAGPGSSVRRGDVLCGVVGVSGAAGGGGGGGGGALLSGCVLGGEGGGAGPDIVVLQITYLLLELPSSLPGRSWGRWGRGRCHPVSIREGEEYFQGEITPLLPPLPLQLVGLK